MSLRVQFPSNQTAHGSVDIIALSIRSINLSRQAKLVAHHDIPYAEAKKRYPHHSEQRYPRHPGIGRRVGTIRIGDFMRKTYTETFSESSRGEAQI